MCFYVVYEFRISVFCCVSPQAQASVTELCVYVVFAVFRYMGIGLSAQGINMNRLPGE